MISLLAFFIALALAGCGARENQAKEPIIPAGKTAWPNVKESPAAGKSGILPLEACSSMTILACKLMSKMYPEQAPACTAYREASGRLVEICGSPDPAPASGSPAGAGAPP
ncbi:MAG TPA: hypothetical protein VNL14_23600 [Candidatus Acidoferrales bacterium]|nr:hypothetical protein [Candidatus Acidoferrales bacterium]